MPRRNRRADKRRIKRETPQPEEKLSGRDSRDVSRMARALVDAGVCSPTILGQLGPRKEVPR